MKKNHITSLQSFRGIAALIVLIHHCTFYFNYDPNIKNLAEIFFNAHAAVVAFYVLSGYVLALSLMKNQFSSYNVLIFYTRRAFRIYPALWAAGLLSLLYLIIFKGIPTSNLVSTWWDSSYRDNEISITKVFINFIGFGKELPIPTWSISLELIASLALPFLVLLMQKSRVLFLISMITLLYISITGSGILKIYMFYFSLGVSIVLWQNIFIKIQKIASLIAIISILLILFGRQIGDWNYTSSYHNTYAALTEGIFSAILIAVISTNTEKFQILKNKSLVLLGDISYSVYLIHLPIMGFIAYGLEKIVSYGYIPENGLILTIILIPLTLISTIILSILSYKNLEKKGITYGVKTINKINSLNN